MKQLIKLLLVAIVAANSSSIFAQTNIFPASGSAGIGTIDPSPSSLLDLTSTSKGLLVPRMTKVQRDAILSPTTGLLIYQTNVNPGFFYYNGASWTAISSLDASKSLNNLTTTAVNITLQPGADNSIDLGSGLFSWKNLYVDGVGYLGAAKVGNFVGTAEAGMIRWNGTEFQGYNGFSWISLSGGGGGGGAATDLSNLTTTAVNVDLLPNFDAMNDLGSSAKNWDNIYLDKTLYVYNIPAYSIVGNPLYPSLLLGDTKNSGDLGNDNILIGRNTGEDATSTAQGNIAIGAMAGSNTTNGTNNIFIGGQAGLYNTTGIRNLAIGISAGQQLSTGVENVFLGNGAGYGNTSGKKNVYLGSYTYSEAEFGGNDSLNVVIGNRAGSYNDGSGTVLIGAFAGHENNQNDNIYIGMYSGFFATEGYDNVYIGENAGHNQQDGYANTILGANAGYNFGVVSGTASKYNVYVGTDAGYYTKGAYNTYVGSKCGDSYIDNEQCVLMGYGTDVSASTITNAIAIGFSTSVSQSNSIRIGNTSINKFGIGRNVTAGSIMEFQATSAKLTTGGVWTDASDKKLKQNIVELDKFDILKKINALSVTQWNYIADDPKIQHVGPMAQDFYATFGLGDDTTVAAMDKAGIALIGIQALTETLQNTTELNDANNATIKLLQEENAALNARLLLLEQYIFGNIDIESIQPTAEIVLLQNNEQVKLEQNIPNPFSGNTIIRYYIPANVQSAQLQISNQQGNIISSTELSSGEGVITVNADQISQGAFAYSLIIDGQIVATKQMIVTK